MTSTYRAIGGRVLGAIATSADVVGSSDSSARTAREVPICVRAVMGSARSRVGLQL